MYEVLIMTRAYYFKQWKLLGVAKEIRDEAFMASFESMRDGS